MIGISSSFLGVVISDKSVACAEVFVSGDRREVRHTATFAFPADASLLDPDAAGQALAGFLRQKRFTASRVVVGIPARWLIAVEKEVPPASEEQTRATLRLQAERLAVAEHGDVVFDFAGRSSTLGPSRVLLVGMLRQRLERVEQMMDAAGMSVLAITSSGLALASCVHKRGGDGGVLVLGRSGGEIVWQIGGAPRMLRHVPFATNGHPDSPSIAPLGAELRRAMTMVQQNGEIGAGELMLLDGLELESDAIAELSQRLGVAVDRVEGAQVLGIQGDISDAETAIAIEARPAGGFAPAMALALAGARPELLPIDFKHSRLTPAPAKRLGRRAIWAIAAGAVALIGLVALLWTVHARQSQLDDINGRIALLKNDVTSAQSTVDQMNYGRGFFRDHRPPVLDCLHEITMAFRDDEKIWAGTFSLRENGKGQLAGRAADQKIVLAVLDRLKQNTRFSDVKLLDMREADARTHEMSYSISFGFDATE